MSQSMLRYDFEGLLEGAIDNELALSPTALDAMNARLSDAREAILGAHDEGTLGFLDLVDQDLDALLERCDAIRKSKNFTQQVVLGIGGSSLGALAILESAAQRPEGLETFFSENVDPHSFLAMLDALRLEETLLVVITKSGTTIETMSKFWILYERLIEAVGEEVAPSHVVAITDPARGSLRPLATARGFETFEVPPNVGGRFSVLTAVGLVPLAIAGYDVVGLLDGARAARDAFLAQSPGENASMQAAAHAIMLSERGVSSVVMMAYCDRLLPMVDWFRQLWAESLGKRVNRAGEVVHVGITPIKALGVIDQHSQVQLYAEGPNDKQICFLEVDRIGAPVTVPDREGFPSALSHLVGKSLGELLEAELEGTKLALRDAGRPTSSWRMGSGSASEIGAFILSWEISTAVAGELWDIDAFDQPGVELGKRIAHGLLGREDLIEFAAGYASGDTQAAERAALDLL